MKKRFLLSPAQMKRLVPDMGGCLITDRVTVDGLKIGYMYREKAVRSDDSGWRFFSGDESQEYIDDLSHTDVYEVNTAANYDPDIIPCLRTPAPCAFEKIEGSHEYKKVDREFDEESETPTEDPGDLDPEFPILDGYVRMTKEWAVTLPGEFNQRIEDGSVVLWRPGITAWTVIFMNDKGMSQQERLRLVREGLAPEAFDAEVFVEDGLTRFAYRLTERPGEEEEVIHALYSFAIGDIGHVQMAIYVDDENDLDVAKQMWKSLEATPAT